jgi:hypothetical protein
MPVFNLFFMNKKSWVLIVIALVLGGLYVIYFSNWFKPKIIQISYTRRSGITQFSLGNPYELTSVKVFSVSALQSNKYALPVWQLKSESKSDPVRNFFYGRTIPGMEPIVSNARPDPLEPGVTYRIVVETAHSQKAEHDFTP